MLPSSLNSNWSWETDRKTQTRLTSSCNLPATAFLVTPHNSTTEVVLNLTRDGKNAFLSSITGSKWGKYCRCYTPLWPPIKDDGCRRGSQSGRGSLGWTEGRRWCRSAMTRAQWPGPDPSDLPSHTCQQPWHSQGGGLGPERKWSGLCIRTFLHLASKKKNPVSTSF